MLVAPPGTGKTVIACALIAQRRVPTAVIVRTRELAAQWHDRLTRFLDVLPGTKAKPTHVVDIISAVALGRKDTDASFLEKYGHVIVDECHGVAAPGLTAALSKLNIRYWTGLTATPYRSDGLDRLITMLLGPIRHTIAPQRTTRREYHPHLTEFTHEILGPVDMTEIYNALAADAARNALVLASPISFKGNIIQRIGRVTRGETNATATVHDFNDYNCPPLATMFKRRQRVIKNEGFDIIPVTGTPDTPLPLSPADVSAPRTAGS
ncbi:DEAD/DEAH box helicase [Corynebacterium phoceense]|uniref:DEAD/DEAH box helicase n=1 Tax=Corynebacterium phoceense TaxID=1686286 RepID=UPI003BF48AC8